MSKDKQYIDGVLITWGEVLFGRSVRSKKDATGAAVGTGKARQVSARPGSVSDEAAVIRKKLAALVCRKPEVMVKITGSGKNIRQIKNHLDYVSRNGELALEDQEGELIQGKRAVRDLRDEWRNGRYVIPDQEGRVRESFNIVLSMPPGTDRIGVTRAARDFALELFGGRQDFVFAAHDDEDHPHVHLVVRSRNYDGKRLNPRKEDLQEWREIFAAKLGSYGIEAAATKGRTRSVATRSGKRSTHEARRRGAEQSLIKDRVTEAVTPTSAGSFELEAVAERALRRLAIELATSGGGWDRELGRAVARYWRKTFMPIDEPAQAGPQLLMQEKKALVDSKREWER